MAKLGSGGQVTPLNYESGGRSSNLFGSASYFSDLTRGRRAVGRWSASVASAQRADLRPARAAAPKAVVLSASAFSPESDTTVGIQIVDLPMVLHWQRSRHRPSARTVTATTPATCPPDRTRQGTAVRQASVPRLCRSVAGREDIVAGVADRMRREMDDSICLEVLVHPRLTG
jgi:hypothetical protein